MKSGKLDFIDSLRGIAVLLVITVHVSQHVNGLPIIFEKLLSQGSRGVILFYIASAFTLFLSLSKRNKEGISNYYTRRLFRIAPLYFVSILAYLLINGLGPRYWLGDAESVSSANIISHFLFINGFNPYWINSILGVEWSIAVEMLFYLIVPFLFIKIRNFRQAMMFLFFASLINFFFKFIFSKINPINDNTLWNNYLNLWFPEQLPVFALGFILFFLWNDKRNLNIHTGKELIILITLLIVCSVLSILNHSITFLFGVFFLAFSYYLSSFKPKLFVNKIFVFFGKISYSIYLTHFLIIQLVHKFLVGHISNPLVQLGVTLLLSLLFIVAISIMTYRYIELPGIYLGKALISKFKKSKDKNSGNNIPVNP